MQKKHYTVEFKKSIKALKSETATAGKTAVACFVLTVALALSLCGCKGAVVTDTESKTEDVLEHPENYTAEDVISMWKPEKINPALQTDRLIAHGGGEIEGCDTSNSAEALMNAADSGYSLVEMDFNITSDGHVVLVHDWNETTEYYYQTKLIEPVSLEEFKGFLSYGKFHVMELSDLIHILDMSDTFRIVTDAKTANLEVLTAIAEQYPAYLDRFIPQIYQYDQYQTVKDLGYKDIILTLYMMQAPVVEEIADFYEEKGLYAITISVEDYMDKIANRLAGKGVKIYRHPVNSFEESNDLMEEGVYGVYTSGLLPREYTSPDADYYITMPDEDGREVKLTDYTVNGNTVADIVARRVHGMDEGEYRIYYIGDDGLRMSDQSLDDLPYGEVHMPVEIWEVDERFVGHFTGRTLDYYLWKDRSGVRILDAKFKYRADQLKVAEDLGEVEDRLLAGRDDEELCRDILDRAFIAKSGEYLYYVNGIPGAFKLANDYIYAFESDGEKEGERCTYVPVAEAAKALGADEVTMSEDGVINIHISWKKTTDFASSRYLYPYKPYLRKTLVCGRYLADVFGRGLLEGEEGVIVILPRSIEWEKLSEETKAAVLQVAGELY